MKKALLLLTLILSFGLSAQENKAPYQKALEKTKEKSYTLYETPKGLVAKDSTGQILLNYIQGIVSELEAIKIELVEQRKLKQDYFNQLQELSKQNK
jgi:hypothetical protein